MLEDYREMLDYAEWFEKKNVIIVPHGSLVEYLGANNFRNLEVPTFGNRNILHWESSRALQRQWLEDGGCTMPKVVEDPHNIDGPVIVKYAGAKGGRGYFIARDYRDFRRNVDIEEEFTIQEYVLGCRYYLHFFFDPTAEDGYQVQGRGPHAGKNLGRLELLSMDRRDESNVDEFYKLGSLRDLREMALEPSFVVTGNQPVVIRESLLPRAFEMAEGTVAASYNLEEGSRGHARAVLLGDHRPGPARIQGVRNQRTHRGRLQPLHRRLTLLRHQRTVHVHRTTHRTLHPKSR